jgi:hypothetical protein
LSGSDGRWGAASRVEEEQERFSAEGAILVEKRQREYKIQR